MTNPKEVLEHINHQKGKEAKVTRGLAIIAFDKLLKNARRDFCINHPSCNTCIYKISSNSLDYTDNPNETNCYARRFHEEAIAMLMKKEGVL